MKLLIMQSPPSSNHLLPLRSKYSPQRPVLKSNTKIDVFIYIVTYGEYDDSVGIALGYGLDEPGSGVRLPAGAGNFSLHHRVQNGSGAYPASYPMGTRGSFPGGKAAGE
jgi:hypothetical protein